MTLKIRLLGGFRLWRDRQPVAPQEWKTEKAKVLLEILLTEPGRVFTTDELIEHLWPEADPERAAVSLRGRVSELRYILEPALERGADSQYILTERQGYSFNPHADYRLDVAEFAQYTEEAEALEREGRYEEAIAEYQAAVELYGDYLPEERYEDWAIAQAERWRGVYLDLLSHLADLHARLGQYRRAIARCYQALREERYRESLYRQLMLYCYLAGNQAEALRVYERCQDLLSQELGTEPAEETRELYRQIWQRRLPEADRVYPTPRIERHPIPYPLSRTPFVGREEEFARLVQYLERARLGKGSVVLIAGEAGVGKTRLASEFTGYARRTARVSILQGFCQELEIKLAYQPLIEALRGGLAELAPEALGGTTPLWLAEVAKLVPELHEKIPDLPANPALPPEQERGRLFEGIVQFLVGLARQAPLIVLLDDLQWVDPSTCDLLHYLTPRLREQPILLLGTYRREEVDEEHPLTGLIRKSRGSFQLIELSRLSFEEVEGLLTDLAPSLNEPFRRRIYEETAGNPFFIVSILQNLFEEGALKVDERGRWVTDIDDITLNYRELMISPGIREAIRRRLSVLAEDERRFLKLAAIIGRELDPALLKRAWGGEGQGEVELVERLLETNLIVEAEGRYEFSHPKISEVAYEETSGERRQEWHRRVGEVIEELYAERLDEYYILLAHHYYHGEDWAKALEYTLLALKGAVKSHQLKEGLKLAELGLQSVERAGEEGAAESSLWEKRFDILARRASIYDLLGESAKQEDDISTMLQLASRIPDLGRLLQAHQWRAEWYHAAGEYHQEIEEAERVLELTRRLKDRRGEGTALHTIGNAYNNLGEYHQALRYYERAYPILREVGARSGEGLALKNIGTIHHSQGRYSEALAYYEQALKIHQRVGYRVGEGIVLNNIGGIYASLGTYEQALEHCQAAYRIYREIGYHMGEEYALTNLATIYRGLGQSDRALECLEQARGMCQELGHRMVEAMVRHGLGLVALDERKYHQAVGHFEEALQVLKELRTKELEVEALSWLGIAQLKLGDLAGAFEGSGRAVKLLEAGQETEQPQAIYFNHFRVLSALDREEEAQTYLEKAYETLLERARRIGDRALEESFFEGVELHREILQEWESNR